jgi:hypothetical protein
VSHAMHDPREVQLVDQGGEARRESHPSSAPARRESTKASCQKSFRVDLPHSDGIAEDAVVSVTSRLALRLLPLASAVSGRVWPGLAIQGQVA